MNNISGPWRWEIADGNDFRLVNTNEETILDGWDDAGVHVSKDAKPLIAAAPDMLEAVRELLATHPGHSIASARADNAIKIARAAIAKAEGE